MSNDNHVSADAAIAFSLATAVPGIFGFFCPGPLDQAQHDPASIRLQQSKASIASLGLGVAASVLAKKPWPFLIALGMVGLLMWEYTSARQEES